MTQTSTKRKSKLNSPFKRGETQTSTRRSDASCGFFYFSFLPPLIYIIAVPFLDTLK